MGSNQASDHDFLELENEETSSEVKTDKFILLKDLEKYIFSPGTLVWKKKLILLNPGDLIEHKYFEKFEKITDRISCDFVLKPWNISAFNQLFLELKLAKKLKVKNEVRIKILKWFKSIYWTGEKEGVLAEVMEASFETFYSLPKDIDKKMKNINIDLFRIYAFKSSLLVIFSLAIGITDYEYLKELYHLPFFHNMGLNNTLSYNHVEALKNEWDGKGTALDYLKINNVKEIEIKNFLNNPEKSSDEYQKYFWSEKNTTKKYYSHLILLKSYERPVGEEDSKNIYYNELSDLENILIYISGNFGLNFVSPKKLDYKLKLESIINNDKNISSRLKLIIQNVFNELNEDTLEQKSGGIS